MLALLFLSVCFAVLSVTAEAKTFFVNSTLDEVDAALGDEICATAGGVCTLRAAIQEANALAGPDVIKLKTGLYMLKIAGISENACATGDLDITDDLTITGTGAKKTFINGGKLDRVFHVIDPLLDGISVTIADMTIENGVATDDGYGDTNYVIGGGILNESGSSTLALKGITLSHNTASGGVDGRGGGIYNSGTLRITKSLLSNSTLSDNAVTGGSSGVEGGAIYNNAGTLTIKATTIFNNIVSGPNVGYGGAIGNWSILEIRQSTISNNTVSVQGVYGGGGGISNHGTMTIIQSTISNNTAQGGVSGHGGGISNSGDLTITTSIISSNIARGPFASGGGISTYWGNVVITGSTLSNNAASAVSGNPGMGGGILLGDYTTVTVQGASKILRNFASDAGGGICYAGAGTGSISADSTVTKNIPDNIYPQP
jgi:CSLREA domain-containing protein